MSKEVRKWVKSICYVAGEIEKFGEEADNYVEDLKEIDNLVYNIYSALVEKQNKKGKKKCIRHRTR